MLDDSVTKAADDTAGTGLPPKGTKPFATVPPAKTPPAAKPDKVTCPSDLELLRPISAGTQREAYARAEACFARGIADGLKPRAGPG